MALASGQCQPPDTRQDEPPSGSSCSLKGHGAETSRPALPHPLLDLVDPQQGRVESGAIAYVLVWELLCSHNNGINSTCGIIICTWQGPWPFICMVKCLKHCPAVFTDLSQSVCALSHSREMWWKCSLITVSPAKRENRLTLDPATHAHPGLSFSC